MTPLGGALERRSHHKSLLILLGGRAKEDRDLCEAPQRVSVMSPTQLVHFLVIKFLLVMLLASNWSPTFLLSQDIYSQMFTDPTPSPMSLLQVGEKETFAEMLRSSDFFGFRVISTEHLLCARHCA